MIDEEFVRSLPVGVRHVRNGVVLPAFDPAALRVKRHILLGGVQRLTHPYWTEKIDPDTGEITKKSEFRVSICCRQPVGDSVTVYQNGSSVGYSGLMRCGNAWGCPICCAKVMRRRGEQISALFDAVQQKGGSAVMVTHSAGHQLGDKLADLLTAFKGAKRAFTQDRNFRHLSATRIGAVSATEITYGLTSGWHPHQHDVWFFDHPFDQSDLLASQLFPIWRKACAAKGLRTIEFFRGKRIGIDVRPAWDASEYMTKFDRERDWSLSAEITAGRLKSGKAGSLTPWALLERAILEGAESESAALFVEYLRATKGKSIVSLMGARKLLEELGLPTTLDDFADANAVGEGIVLGQISPGEFDRVVRAGGLGRMLERFRQDATFLN